MTRLAVLFLVLVLPGCAVALAGEDLAADLLEALERHSAPVVEFGTQYFQAGSEREVVGQSCVVAYQNADADNVEYVDYSACCPEGWYVLGLSPAGGVLCREE